MKITWSGIERLLAFCLWLVFLWFMSEADGVAASLPYLAGMIACGAYIRAVDALEKIDKQEGGE